MARQEPCLFFIFFNFRLDKGYLHMIKKLFLFFCKKDLTFTCKREYNNDMMRSVKKKKKIDPSKYKIKEGKRLAIPLFMRD